MRGFILRTQLVREEDLIVEVLTPRERLTLYRFYGARHPQIEVGFLIDFYPEHPPNWFGVRLRHPIQLRLGFETSPTPLYWWQRFVKLVEMETRGAGPLSPTYFQLLLHRGKELAQRPPVRVVGEGVVELLRLEGRLANSGHCLSCGHQLREWVVVDRDGGPFCPRCRRGVPPLPRERGGPLLEEGRSLLLEEGELRRWLEWLLPPLSYNFRQKVVKGG